MPNTTGDLLNDQSDPAQDPAIAIENQTILGFHAALEALSHDTNTVAALHGLTDAGETVGLGKIGGDNLITDVAQIPGDTLDGANPITSVADLVTDAGQSTTAAGNFVQGVGTDLGHPNLVNDVTDGLTGVALGDGSGSESLISANAGGTPIDIAPGNPNIVDANVLNGGDDHLVTGAAGAHGGPTYADTGLLTNPDSSSPIGTEIGNGPNLVDATALGDSQLPQTLAPTFQALNGGPAGENIVNADGGSPDGAPIADAGIFTTPDSSSPIGAELGNGQNIASVDALSQTAGHIVTGEAGMAGASQLADAGVLTSPDAQTPVGAEVANGNNLADANLLSHSDILSFPSLQGTGTDALSGVVPGNINVGNVVTDGSGTTFADSSLLDASTDGGPLLQIHNNPTSTVGLNDHPIV
jgi:hypothetical protein